MSSPSSPTDPPAAPVTSTPVGTLTPAAAALLTEPEPEEHHRWRRLQTWLILIGAVALVVVVMQLFVVQTFTISTDSTSMEPTLYPGERILAVKVGFSLHRGDIVVLRPPPTAVRDINHEDLVKRILGMPGDAIWSVGNKIYVNGHQLKEPWLRPNEPLGPMIGYQVIPKGYYFLLGDNLAPSYDSRYWGAVPRSDIVAKVECIVWDAGPDLHCF